MHETLAKQMERSVEHGNSPAEALSHRQIALQSTPIFRSEQEVGCPECPCHTLAVMYTHGIP